MYPLAQMTEVCLGFDSDGVEALEKGIGLRMKQAEDGGSEGYFNHVVFTDEEDENENKKQRLILK